MQLTLIKNPDTSKSIASGLTLNQIASDKNIFDSLNENSNTHEYIKTEPTNKGFQMCLRVVNRMLHGALPDCCYGATKFHDDNRIPDWAISRGYIADIDGLLFYL